MIQLPIGPVSMLHKAVVATDSTDGYHLRVWTLHGLVFEGAVNFKHTNQTYLCLELNMGLVQGTTDIGKVKENTNEDNIIFLRGSDILTAAVIW